MPPPIRELCIRALQATLESIRLENGYVYTVQTVQRFRQRGQTTGVLPGILIRETDEDASEGPSGGPSGSLTTRHLEVGLRLMLNQLEEDSRSADELMTLLRADVQVALAGNRFLDGYAVDTRELNNEPIEINDGMAELSSLMTYQIHYRHRRNDPRLAE